MTILLLATTNPGKRVEMFAILADLGCQVGNPPAIATERAWQALDAGSLGILLDVAEDGKTYAENAAIKATAYCQASGLVTLADDSGLEVDVLDGAPGMHSARYSSKPGATDADRRALLLSHLAGKPFPWKARFHCAVAIAVPRWEPDSRQGTEARLESTRDDRATGLPVDVFHFHGICEGEIIPEERGSHGFGYDPIFFIPEQDRTMAELETREKNNISHRGRALAAAKPFLDELIRAL